jgi:Uri superfamily endonuclease
LQSALQLEEIWWTHDPVRREHQWASVVQRLRSASIPLQGFGASDCVCVTHLYFFARPPSFSAFCRCLQHEAREVSPDKTVDLKAPLRLLWRHPTHIQTHRLS